MESDAPSLDDMLHHDKSRVESADMLLFYQYFDEIKEHVRKYLCRQARQSPGLSEVAHSALSSLFRDVTHSSVPLSDVDKEGYPALWPLLLKYIERHCNKWNRRYRALKRKGEVVSLSAGGIDPPDYRSSAEEEQAFDRALKDLNAKLTPRQQRIIALRVADYTVSEIAVELNCTKATVLRENRAIRGLLENA